MLAHAAVSSRTVFCRRDVPLSVPARLPPHGATARGHRTGPPHGATARGHRTGSAPVHCCRGPDRTRPYAARMRPDVPTHSATGDRAVADYDMTWAKADPDHVPPEIDTTQPSVARVYDAILGGKDNFAVDRAVAAEAVAVMGDRGNGARLNRAALGRAVRYMALQGVDQFLDLGSGLPTVQNTHQIAQTINPDARVVYVDNDPSVSLHGKALLADDASTTVVLADIRTPDALLGAPE